MSPDALIVLAAVVGFVAGWAFSSLRTVQALEFSTMRSEAVAREIAGLRNDIQDLSKRHSAVIASGGPLSKPEDRDAAVNASGIRP